MESRTGREREGKGGHLVSAMQSRTTWKTIPRPLDRWKSPPGISAAGHLLPDLEEKSTGEVDFERGYARIDSERERERGEKKKKRYLDARRSRSVSDLLIDFSIRSH